MQGLFNITGGTSMATNLEGMFGVRNQLNAKGVDNSRIGYDKTTGYVTLDGQNFLKPQTIQQGTSYTNANDFNNAYSSYNINQNTNAIQQAVQQPQANPYDSQVNDTLQQIMSRINTPSQYDPYNSPEYAAYQAQAQRQAQQGIRSAQESMGAAGLGRSSNLADRAQGIQNQATEYLQTQVVPQLIAANQQREQQQLSNLYNMMNALSSQQGLVDTRQQQALGNQMNVLDMLTGQQQNQRQYEVQQAQLTGFMPDGTPTSDQQQRELQNLWMVADQTGTIPNELANLYGLQPGTPTRAAKEFAAQIAVSRQNAATSAYSAQTSRMNHNLSQDEFAYRKEQDALDRQAIAGTPKDPNYSYKADPLFADELNYIANSPADAVTAITQNKEALKAQYGNDGYNDLLNTAKRARDAVMLTDAQAKRNAFK